MKRSIKIGERSIPLWIIVVLLVSIISVGVLGDYLWKTLFLSVEVKEPLEILSYPSTLSLYPGETEEFNITIKNHASVNYSVILDFSLDNTTYQDSYVTFSNGIYIVIPGQQNLTAWLMVKAVAPQLDTSLTIDFKRGAYPSGLVGYWRLDEGAGIIAFDSSENDNHGILVNSPQWVNGKYGKALSFDGIDDYVEIADSSSLRVQSFSLEAWIYMTKRPYQHGELNSAIINKLNFDPKPVCKGYKIQFEAPSVTNDNLVISIGDGIEQKFLVSYNSINDLTLNQWHHIVGTYDGTIAKIYIDGILRASSTPQSYVIAHDEATLRLGGEYYYAGCSFSGLIDNAMVYNRALSPEEVEAQHTSQFP